MFIDFYKFYFIIQQRYREHYTHTHIHTHARTHSHTHMNGPFVNVTNEKFN
jgi:hypothetical protein